jgi:hypothetical protein
MDQGSFSGNPRTEWLCDGDDERAMRLLDDFWYRDPDGRRWDAPAGTVVDGATIPRTLWAAIGSPYTGNYRRASIVHDVACNAPAVPRRDADTMFYFACLAGGCSVLQAKLLYAGVRLGGLFGQRMPAGYRLPGQQSARELSLRARYTLLAQELMHADADFHATQGIVDRYLLADSEA